VTPCKKVVSAAGGSASRWHLLVGGRPSQGRPRQRLRRRQRASDEGRPRISWYEPTAVSPLPRAGSSVTSTGRWNCRPVESFSGENLLSLLESVESAISELKSRKEPRLKGVISRLERRRAENRRGPCIEGPARAVTHEGLRAPRLDRPAAPAEVSDSADDHNHDDRECQKPGPPAVSCEEQIDLRCWVRPRKRPCGPVSTSVGLKNGPSKRGRAAGSRRSSLHHAFAGPRLDTLSLRHPDKRRKTSLLRGRVSVRHRGHSYPHLTRVPAIMS
jgi:hypothetical protein